MNLTQRQPVPIPEKKRASRKPIEPAAFEHLVKTLAESAKLIGASFVKPKNPKEVPRDAPDNGEWHDTVSKLLKTIPVYKDLYKERSKAGGKKSKNSGLVQYVYFSKKAVQFFNTNGTLGENTFPIDESAGGLGLGTRALATSAIVAYLEAHNLKHPNNQRYVRPDAALLDLIGADNLQMIKHAPPKVKKPKEGKKPKTPKPKVLLLEYNGEMIDHFSFDAIPSICNLLVVNLPPRNVSPENAAQLVKTRSHLGQLTDERQEAKKQLAKEMRKQKKETRVIESIAPVQILTLN